MNQFTEMMVGTMIGGSGTVINLLLFVFSGLEFGFIGNLIYLALPFIIGFSLIMHSMSRTLKQVGEELNGVRK